MKPERIKTDPLPSVHGETTTGLSVLLVEPDGEDQSRLARMVAVRGHRVIGTGTLDAARVLLASCPVDLLLLSDAMLGTEARELVAMLQRDYPDCTMVVLTGGEQPVSGIRPARFESLTYYEKPFAESALPPFEQLLEELQERGVSAV